MPQNFHIFLELGMQPPHHPACLLEETKAIFTLIQINLQTAFLSRKRIKCSPSTSSFSNHFAVHTETLLRRDCNRDNMAIGMLVFLKSPIFADFGCPHLHT